MVARSHSRGWPIKWTGIEWIYIDTNENAQVVRPCRRCGKWPTVEGHDACLGELVNVVSACCGHGVTDAILIRKRSTK